MWGYLCVVVMLVAAVTYLLSPKPKVDALALVAFGCGLLVTLLRFQPIISLLGK